MKEKLPTLTLAGWEHIASAADNVRLPTKCVATEPQQADHGPSGPRHMGNPGSKAGEPGGCRIKRGNDLWQRSLALLPTRRLFRR
jgi:hypothetical protein